MPITIEQAKGLKDGDRIVVSNTGTEWVVVGKPTVNRDPRKVTIKINNGHFDSYVDQDRLHLFDLASTKAAKPDLPSVDDAVDALRPGLIAAYHEAAEAGEIEVEDAGEPGNLVISEEDAEKLIQKVMDEQEGDRIEDKVTKEPELTKPARKPRKKNHKP